MYVIDKNRVYYKGKDEEFAVLILPSYRWESGKSRV
jgi:hypothetical protein